MADVVEALNRQPELALAWRLIVGICAAYLIVFGAIALIRPAVASRFLEGHAASPRLNLVEAALRLIAGIGFMGASPGLAFSPLFLWFGLMLAATAAPMLFLYGLHKRYAGWAVPFAVRMLPLLGVFALVIGGFVAWALVQGPPAPVGSGLGGRGVSL